MLAPRKAPMGGRHVQVRIPAPRTASLVRWRRTRGSVMMSTVTRSALAVALLAFGLAVVPVARAIARSYVFPVGKVPIAPIPGDFERYTWLARDGVPVHALGLPADPSARTIVYFHNNRET